MSQAIPEVRVNALRKKVRGLSGLAAVGRVIFQPADREQWVLNRAYHKSRVVVGTVSDAQGIRLTNGTANIVAAVDLFTVEGQVQRLNIAGNAVIDRDHPLTLVVDDPGAIATSPPEGRITYDLILFLEQID